MLCSLLLPVTITSRNNWQGQQNCSIIICTQPTDMTIKWFGPFYAVQKTETWRLFWFYLLQSLIFYNQYFLFIFAFHIKISGIVIIFSYLNVNYTAVLYIYIYYALYISENISYEVAIEYRINNACFEQIGW